jgi:hypothetical protein
VFDVLGVSRTVYIVVGGVGELVYERIEGYEWIVGGGDRFDARPCVRFNSSLFVKRQN